MFASIFQNRSRGSGRRTERPRPQLSLHLERLEDRTLLAFLNPGDIVFAREITISQFDYVERAAVYRAPQLFQLGSSFSVSGINFPNDFGPETVTLGQTTTISSGRLALSETVVPDGPNAAWAIFNFSTTDGGPLAGDFGSLWGISINDVRMTHFVNIDDAFMYWTENGNAFSPLDLWGNVTKIGPNPIDPQLGPVFFLPASGTGTSLDGHISVTPYDFLFSVGIDLITADGFHFAVHVTSDADIEIEDLGPYSNHLFTREYQNGLYIDNNNNIYGSGVYCQCINTWGGYDEPYAFRIDNSGAIHYWGSGQIGDNARFNDITSDSNGSVFTTYYSFASSEDRYGIARLDPATDRFMSFVELPGANGIAAANGEIYVTTPDGTFAIDPATKDMRQVAGGADDVAVAPSGRIYITNSSTGTIERIDPASGASEQILEGGLLTHPKDVTVDSDGSILVVDFPDLNDVATSRIIRINPQTGDQSVVLSGENISGGLAVARRSIDAPVPFTVITHGLRFTYDTGPIPPWVSDLDKALQARGASGADDLLFDWVAKSNLDNADPGWAESAGDELFARIMWEAQHRYEPFDLHYVGHSRGTVVNSEANERLAYYERAFPSTIGQKFKRVQFTTLDPHPANLGPDEPANAAFSPEAEGPISRVVDEWFERRTRDPLPQIWDNVDWADNYYQRTQFAFPPDFPVNLWGREIAGGHNDLAGDGDGFLVGIQSHNTVPYWYIDTVKRNDDSHGGYYFSLAEPGWEDRPLPSTPQGTAPGRPQVVFNGEFLYDGFAFDDKARLVTVPGWSGRLFGVRGESDKFIRLETTEDPSLIPASITHDPMFIPPGASVLKFDLTNWARRGDVTLTAYFVPAKPIDTEKLAPVFANRRVLGTWSLANNVAVPVGQSRTFGVPLDNPSPLGLVGSIQFELSAINPRTGLPIRAFIDLDNVAIGPPWEVEAVAGRSVSVVRSDLRRDPEIFGSARAPLAAVVIDMFLAGGPSTTNSPDPRSSTRLRMSEKATLEQGHVPGRTGTRYVDPGAASPTRAIISASRADGPPLVADVLDSLLASTKVINRPRPIASLPT